MSLVRELEALELEALSRPSPELRVCLGTRSGIDVRLPCKGPAKVPAASRIIVMEKAVCWKSLNVDWEEKGEAVCLGSLRRGVWIPYLGPQQPDKHQHEGLSGVGRRPVGVEANRRAPAPLQRLSTAYIPPSSLCCVLYTPVCHLGRWPVDIMHHSPKTSIHGVDEGRLDPEEAP